MKLLQGTYGLRFIQPLRLFHLNSCCQATNKAALSKLRKKTGFPFINCKKALEKFEYDLSKAEAWLKEQAQKEGWAKATKLQGRPMSQGLVGVITEDNMAAMVEINCETDFVARNTKFHSLVSKATGLCLQHGKASAQSKLLYSKEEVGKLIGEGGSTLADMVALEIGNIGENMAIRRAVFMNASGAHIGSYIHSAGPHQTKDSQCILGRYGALLVFNQSQASSENQMAPSELGRQLGQHIVGMNPKTIGQASDEKCANSDEETKMLFQEFLLDSDLTVGDFLQQHSAEVQDFVRFECGEELPEEQ